MVAGFGDVTSEDTADIDRHSPHSQVLYPIDQRICRSEVLFGNDLWHRRPHCRRDKRISYTEKRDCYICIERHSLRSECDDEMRGKHKSRTDYHPCSCLSYLVNQCTEERCEQDGEERNHCKKHCGDVKIDTEKRQKNRYSELLESDHAAVECHAEQGDHEKARIAQHLPYVRKTEFVFLRSLYLVAFAGLPVESCVQSHEYGPEYDSDGNYGQTYERRLVGLAQCIYLSCWFLRHDHRCDKYGCSGSESCYGKLEAHSKGHVPALEPFGYRPCHRHACDFAAESEKHASYIGDRQ